MTSQHTHYYQKWSYSFVSLPAYGLSPFQNVRAVERGTCLSCSILVPSTLKTGQAPGKSSVIASQKHFGVCHAEFVPAGGVHLCSRVAAFHSGSSVSKHPNHLCSGPEGESECSSSLAQATRLCRQGLPRSPPPLGTKDFAQRIHHT